MSIFNSTLSLEALTQMSARTMAEHLGIQFTAIGEDFIEGHHTIPVSEMKPNHKTKPEEIAMVCSNCHRMLHRKRPWLSIDKLKELIKN